MKKSQLIAFKFKLNRHRDHENLIKKCKQMILEDVIFLSIYILHIQVSYNTCTVILRQNIYKPHRFNLFSHFGKREAES